MHFKVAWVYLFKGEDHCIYKREDHCKFKGKDHCKFMGKDNGKLKEEALRPMNDKGDKFRVIDGRLGLSEVISLPSDVIKST